jgi:type IV secretion system protein VirD4
MGRMRGYGLKFWTFVQNLSQLKNLYGDTWTEISGNAGVVQYFGGTNDPYTAECISKWSGEQTAVKQGHSQSTSPGAGFGTNDSLYGRPVMFAGEVRALPPGEQV